MAGDLARRKRLSKQQQALKKFKRDAEAKSRTVTDKRRKIVAEGDSWFDYSLAGIDIVDCLRAYHRYKVKTFASAGDTLENMIYGSATKGRVCSRASERLCDCRLHRARRRATNYYLTGPNASAILGCAKAWCLTMGLNGRSWLSVRDITHLDGRPLHFLNAAGCIGHRKHNCIVWKDETEILIRGKSVPSWKEKQCV